MSDILWFFTDLKIAALVVIWTLMGLFGIVWYHAHATSPEFRDELRNQEYAQAWSYRDWSIVLFYWFVIYFLWVIDIPELAYHHYKYWKENKNVSK